MSLHSDQRPHVLMTAVVHAHVQRGMKTLVGNGVGVGFIQNTICALLPYLSQLKQQANVAHMSVPCGGANLATFMTSNRVDSRTKSNST